jgi:hypothetical protein
VRRPDTSPRPPQVLREQEGVRGYTELQSKHRATYGDNEEAREAAGRAALLRKSCLPLLSVRLDPLPPSPCKPARALAPASPPPH